MSRRKLDPFQKLMSGPKKTLTLSVPTSLYDAVTSVVERDHPGTSRSRFVSVALANLLEVQEEVK